MEAWSARRSSSISLYSIKRFRRRRHRVKNQEGRGGGGSGGQIIVSPPEARKFWVCSKFGFVRSLGLFEVSVCSKFGFVRSFGLFEVSVCLTLTILGSRRYIYTKHTLVSICTSTSRYTLSILPFCYNILVTGGNSIEANEGDCHLFHHCCFWHSHYLPSRRIMC